MIILDFAFYSIIDYLSMTEYEKAMARKEKMAKKVRNFLPKPVVDQTCHRLKAWHVLIQSEIASWYCQLPWNLTVFGMGDFPNMPAAFLPNRRLLMGSVS